MDKTQMAVPVFKLYGEMQGWPTPDLMHCETISARSSKHHGEIQLHQHVDLYQLFYIRSGVAQVEIEGVHQEIREPSIQVVPPLFVHGFQFDKDVDGYVLTLAAPLVAQLEAQLEPNLSSAACYPVREWSQHLDTLFAVLQSEYEGSETARNTLLQALVDALAVWLARRRKRHDAVSGSSERSRDYLAHYLKLIELHYREHWSIDQYAYRIGVSSTYLNNLCRQFTEHSALQLVHQRLLLEAKRNLIYTAMSVAQIADNLGFADPAYFSRFFKRMSGQTAQMFRQQRPTP
ncbi:helix-turn-helix domain-containing protein [Pseudomonas sp. 5P_3.1_Bac2]|uniref:helix-turn-helix domain-containing protein n=1 Tax=Pseudomonas sp. 5P_3.1_Bac2 TaxID=2971617 RepID=UPI0021C9F81A|nr:helix-turn-helix domain-containing protein [Pseudomonas sp. 5P_3.1_Bac2]MCU1717946.1 helix-turn-helix domain-containing protein [Pseudomonas sp. 5P_3.1_Bac2]